MRKFCFVLSAVMLLCCLAGCNILETDNPPTLPQLDLDGSSLTGTVEFVNGRTIRIVVSEGDSHFDGPYENKRGEPVPGDTIMVTYTALVGSQTVKVGDTVTFTYGYTKDVSEKTGYPHITVNELTVVR